jgi:uncharacterized membrane protein YtjA (UPF0391 family)
MLRWALLSLLIALVAAAFGFGGLASAAAGVAKVLFFIAIGIFAVTLALGLVATRKITR